MFKRTYSLFTAILFFTVLLTLAGCSGGSSTSAGGQGAVTAKLLWGSNKAAAKSVAATPAGVTTVRLAISGPAMTTMQQDFPAANGSGTLTNVPVGSGLTLTASGLDSTGAVIYQGSVNNVTVQAGVTTDVGTIFMTALMGGSVQGKALAFTNRSSTVVSTLAGGAASPVFSGGSADGTGTLAYFGAPTGITTDGTNLYVVDGGGATGGLRTIRKIAISTGVVTTIAGNSNLIATPTGSLSIDGIGTAASFNDPIAITTDGVNLYITDMNYFGFGGLIRKVVLASGAVTTIAGGAANPTTTGGSADGTGALAYFGNPSGITTDGTNLYVVDGGGATGGLCTIRKIAISTGVVTTIAGNSNLIATPTGSLSIDGIGTAASFNDPIAITTDGVNLYITDMNYFGFGGLIRKVVLASGAVTTIAGGAANPTTTGGSADGTGALAYFGNPSGITTDGTNLYVVDGGGVTGGLRTIRKIAISTGVVTTIAGNTTSITGGTVDGFGTVASFNSPIAITTDGQNLYATDQSMTNGGLVRTIARQTGGGGSPAVVPGKLVQGPVSGATVYADNVSSGIRFTQEAGEVFTTTDSNGFYSLPATPTYNFVLISRGGVDTLTSKAAIQMIAPAGSANMSSLTTLVALDTTGAVKAKIEALGGGAKFDADISTNATPAMLNLAKSIDAVIQTLISTLNNGSGGAISAVQLSSVQAQTFQSIAATFAGPSVSAAALATPASLSTIMGTAVTAAATNIASSNTNILIPPTTATAIATASVNAATTAVLGASAVGSTSPANITTSVLESTLITPVTSAALSNAITSAATSAVSTATVTATPTIYTPPVIQVVTRANTSGSLGAIGTY